MILINMILKPGDIVKNGDFLGYGIVQHICTAFNCYNFGEIPVNVKHYAIFYPMELTSGGVVDCYVSWSKITRILSIDDQDKTKLTGMIMADPETAKILLEERKKYEKYYI